MNNQHYVKVKVEHGTLETEVAFFCDPDDDTEFCIAKAKRMTANLRTLPMAYERFTITERREALPED